jgi:hypothetical protein
MHDVARSRVCIDTLYCARSFSIVSSEETAQRLRKRAEQQAELDRLQASVSSPAMSICGPAATAALSGGALLALPWYLSQYFKNTCNKRKW